MTQSFTQDISKELNLKESQVKATLDLLSEGATIPFIARYRKEMTGSLDEVQIYNIQQRSQYLENLSQRKEEVIRLIAEQDKLTPDLSEAVQNALTLQQVEDIYRPYKQKKRTKAMVAVEQGLEPLADWILSNRQAIDLDEKATEFLNEEVTDGQTALAGAHEILAQKVSDEASFREFIRKFTAYNGVLETKLKDPDKDPQAVYHLYYEFAEKLPKVKPHNILAINRAEKEEVLSVKLSLDESPVLRYMNQRFISDGLPSQQVHFLEQVVQDAYKRFIGPAIEREIRAQAKEKADQQAIEVFGQNLRNLLLTAPLKGKVVMGFDPAYRTGCKLAVINETGTVLAKGVIYPHETSKGKDTDSKRLARWEKAIPSFLDMINAHKVSLIAIGNGTASRESEAFVAHVIQTYKLETKYLVVSEAGASVYSTSEIARQEFPDWEASERSAVSIARRVQDPLAELIKIDPQSLGVGQYQHDVAQKALDQELDFVVNVAVNQVGVDINTASVALLQHVSGLTKVTAQNIISLRESLGRFTSRQQVKEVKRLGPKTYEQAVGFLRVLGGENPLDQTNIHPESYPLAEKILTHFDLSISQIGTQPLVQVLKTAKIKDLALTFGAGEETIKDIIHGLIHPSEDIRDGQATPTLRSDVLTLEDLRIGMILEGVVRNVIDFGAFVDIGVKQDGLIHISKLGTKRRVQHPSQVLSVGQIVDVEVVQLDIEKQRIGLKLIKIH